MSESTSDAAATGTTGAQTGEQGTDDPAETGEEGSTSDTGGDSSGDDSSGGETTGGEGTFPPYEGLYDCGPDFPPNEDPRCATSADYGLVGEGPIFVIDSIPGMEIVGGSMDVENSELFVIVTEIQDDTGLLGELDDGSAIFGVDLETGDRRIVSGLSIDVANGNSMVGEGPIMGKTSDVEVGPDGLLYVNGDEGLMSVDPETGNRELIRLMSDETGEDICTYVMKLSPSGSFVVASPDEFYFAWASFAGQLGTSRGVMKYDRTTDTCTTISSSGDTNVGMGPAYSDLLSGLIMVDGSLYGTTFVGEALYRIDPESGQRQIVTKSATPEVGSGDCMLDDYLAASPDGSTIYATGSTGCSGARPVNMNRVVLETGERVMPGDNHGPLGGSNVTGIWAHPHWPVVLMVYSGGIVMYDDESENSVFFSR